MWAIVAKRIADEFVKKFTKSIKEADYSELRNIVAEGLQKVSDSLATDSSSKKREIVLYSGWGCGQILGPTMTGRKKNVVYGGREKESTSIV